jgi:ribonuclease HI
MSYLTVNP